MLGAVAFRMANLINATYYLPFATRALNAVYANIDSDGWLTNAVDPYTFNTPLKQGDHSPEGQAFVLLLQAAWRDFGNLAKQINVRHFPSLLTCWLDLDPPHLSRVVDHPAITITVSITITFFSDTQPKVLFT
jgi:hypothetical protein